jgi:hypothetical protein
MSYSVNHVDGSSDEGITDLELLRDLYDELQDADEEHFEVTVFNDDLGYYITAYESGHVILDKMSDDDPQLRCLHIDGVTRDQVIDMWRKLALGDIEKILAMPWRLGLPERLRR